MLPYVVCTNNKFWWGREKCHILMGNSVATAICIGNLPMLTALPLFGNIIKLMPVRVYDCGR